MKRQQTKCLAYIAFPLLSNHAFAFTPNLRQKYLETNVRTNFNTILYSVSGNDKSTSDSFMSRANNEKRTCIKHFLTQSSVQSFMFLLEQCRDQPTINWMEEFSGTPNLLKYHGTGGFDTARFKDWDSLLLEMIEQKQEKLVIKAKRRGPINPYLKPRPVEFHIEIDPPSLASRILSVREQISKEWNKDLDLVIRSGEFILDSYFFNVANERDNEEFEPNENDDIDDYRERINNTLQNKKSEVFERSVTTMMNNLNPYEDMNSSPFRKGNFDLLHLLATQASVHRVLRELKLQGSESEASFNWLRNFYCERIPTFFDGNQKYFRYDDFIEELLQSTPTVKSESDGKLSIVDPVGLTEKIIRVRGTVAREWKEIMLNIPNDHTDLRRTLLCKQMQFTIKESSVSIGEFE